ncbi:MEDS domain-containing protein [Natronococcus wangiae]|uniref:MEDS domain-containing protein n=1 Tax=Natronococcus wangiae TaxID=3068275 RepID=UPI00273E6A83|nr:MEDS domain-containing protein [Natronococcus sp. AD5]
MSKQHQTDPHERFGLEATLDAVQKRRVVSQIHSLHEEDEGNDHLASIYESQEEQFETVVPFIKEGLERGERCLYVADDNTTEKILDAFREGGIDVETARESRDLSIVTKSDTYLRTGEFDQEAMLEFWQEMLAEARDEEGYEGVRAAAEMTWALNEEKDLDRLVQYEAMLNTIYSGDDYVVLCQYNRERFPAEVISDVIRTHPLVVYDGRVCQNFYYHPPDKFFDTDSPALDINRAVEELVSRSRTRDALQEREQELQSRLHQQKIVTEIGQQALEDRDLDQLMHDASVVVAETLDNEYCKVLELLPGGDEVFLRQGVGWRDGVVGNATVPTDLDSQAGYTLLSEEPIIVEDLRTEERFSGPELLTSHDVVSGISVIIGTVEEPWGVLGTHTTDRREFTEYDVNFVQSVANLLAAAIERHEYRNELEQTVSQLEESNKRLEQFAYAASHDLQEPLRMVSSYNELIEARYGNELDEDAREYLEFAINGADRMREMIDALLEYSRIDTDGGEFEPTDCNAVLESVCDDLRFQIGDEDAEIAIDSLPTVYADESQLTQVFQNLLSNAIKYSGDEPPRITVDVEQRNHEWVFAVSDNGIGIDPENTDQIFDVFQRLHSRDEHEGTGIGLALCQRIIERHNGRIWVESEPGEESIFFFTLPIKDIAND